MKKMSPSWIRILIHVGSGKWKVETVFHFLCGDNNSTNATDGIFHSYNSNETGVHSQWNRGPFAIRMQRVQNNYTNTRNILWLSVLFTVQRCHYVRLPVSRDCSLFYQFLVVEWKNTIETKNLWNAFRKHSESMCFISKTL